MGLRLGVVWVSRRESLLLLSTLNALRCVGRSGCEKPWGTNISGFRLPARFIWFRCWLAVACGFSLQGNSQNLSVRAFGSPLHRYLCSSASSLDDVTCRLASLLRRRISSPPLRICTGSARCRNSTYETSSLNLERVSDKGYT
jgi:hypothetical protein